MSLKSMSGMLAANQGAIGLRSKLRSAFSRNLVIQSGSPFHQEMSRTVCSFTPFSGRNTYSSTSLQPSLYLPRSRSVVAIPCTPCSTLVGRRQTCTGENFPYGDSNNPPHLDHPHHDLCVIGHFWGLTGGIRGTCRSSRWLDE